MAVMRLRSSGPGETRDIGNVLAAALEPGDVVVLAGELGSGKTVLAQGIARGLGVDEPVPSPTFVIVREYRGRLPLAHVDVYRLDHVQELHDLGFEEVVDGEGVTVIEWGDRVRGVLPRERLEIALEGSGGAERKLLVSPLGTRWQARLAGMEDTLRAWKEA